MIWYLFWLWWWGFFDSSEDVSVLEDEKVDVNLLLFDKGEIAVPDQYGTN